MKGLLVTTKTPVSLPLERYARFAAEFDAIDVRTNTKINSGVVGHSSGSGYPYCLLTAVKTTANRHTEVFPRVWQEYLHGVRDSDAPHGLVLQAIHPLV